MDLLIEVPLARSSPLPCLTANSPHCAKETGAVGAPPPPPPSLAERNAQWTGKGAAWEGTPQNSKSQIEIATWGTPFDFCF